MLRRHARLKKFKGEFLYNLVNHLSETHCGLRAKALRGGFYVELTSTPAEIPVSPGEMRMVILGAIAFRYSVQQSTSTERNINIY